MRYISNFIFLMISGTVPVIKSDYDIKMAAKHPNTLMRVYDIYNKKIYSYDSNGIKKIYKR